MPHDALLKIIDQIDVELGSLPENRTTFELLEALNLLELSVATTTQYQSLYELCTQWLHSARLHSDCQRALTPSWLALYRKTNILLEKIIPLFGKGDAAEKKAEEACESLKKVFEQMIEKSDLRIPEETQAETPLPYVEEFLVDESGVFSSLEEVIIQLESTESTSIQFKESLEKLFRSLHTIKGNGLSFGLPKLAHYAHTIEDIVQMGITQKSYDDIRFRSWMSLEIAAFIGYCDMVRVEKSEPPAFFAQVDAAVEQFLSRSKTWKTATPGASILPFHKKEAPKKELPKRWLKVVRDGKECLVAGNSVTKLLVDPALSRVGSSTFVFWGETLVPYIASNTKSRWAVICSGQCFEVDSILGVVEGEFQEPVILQNVVGAKC